MNYYNLELEMKKILFGGCIITSMICSCICSCSTKTTNNDSQVQTTTVSTTSAQTEIEETTSLTFSTTQNTEPSTYEKMKYNFHVETVSADSIFNTEIITMPETINGFDYGLCDFNGDKIVVQIYSNNQGEDYSEYGLFDLDSLTYEKIVSDSDDLYFLCARGNDYVFMRESDDVWSLEYYNSETLKFKIMMYLNDDLYFDERSVAFYKDKILFDIQTTSSVSIYEYNINTAKTNIFLNDAFHPFVYNNNLKYLAVNKDTKKYEKVVDCSDNSEYLINNDYICDIAIGIGDSSFGLTSIDDESNPDFFNYFMEVVELKNDGNCVPIISTQLGSGEQITPLCINSFCVGWFDWTGDENTPCVYEIKDKKLVLFDCLNDCYYSTYLGDNIGLIYDDLEFEENRQICIFSPK